MSGEVPCRVLVGQILPRYGIAPCFLKVYTHSRDGAAAPENEGRKKDDEFHGWATL